MMNSLKKLQKMIDARLSGEIGKMARNNIKDTEQRLKIINELLPLYDDKWLSWYKSSCEERIKYYKFIRLFPSKLYYKINRNRNILHHIEKNGEWILKDIIFSFDSKHADYI